MAPQKPCYQWQTKCDRTFADLLSLEGTGAFEFTSESSPFVVLGFLGTGLFLAWLDSRQQVHSLVKTGSASANTNPSSVNSPHAVTGLIAGGNNIINQGISEDTLLAAIDVHRIALQVHRDSSSEPREIDEELVWRLLDDIKAARRTFEREEAAKLLADLKKSFERSGNSWPKLVRAEALLLMAEEERARILQSRAQRHPVDLTRLQQLLKELRDAGN